MMTTNKMTPTSAPETIKMVMIPLVVSMTIKTMIMATWMIKIKIKKIKVMIMIMMMMKQLTLETPGIQEIILMTMMTKAMKEKNRVCHSQVQEAMIVTIQTKQRG